MIDPQYLKCNRPIKKLPVQWGLCQEQPCLIAELDRTDISDIAHRVRHVSLTNIFHHSKELGVLSAALFFADDGR